MMITRMLIALALTATAAVPATAQAPQASADALYCMRVEPATGSRIETVQCWTRAEWADAEVDIDTDWAREGVRVIGG
ncbi:MAG: hypothetical protein ABIO29_01420 [Sphingomicrobium sp.]